MAVAVEVAVAVAVAVVVGVGVAVGPTTEVGVGVAVAVEVAVAVAVEVAVAVAVEVVVAVVVGTAVGFKSSIDGFSLSQKIRDLMVIVILSPSASAFGLKIWKPRIQFPTHSSVTAKVMVFSCGAPTIFLPQSGCLPAFESALPTISVSYRAWPRFPPELV